MENKLISIIIPVYNVESYLERCIKSIIDQSYTNLEIILIDDGSTDSSASICKKYAEIDSRIIFLQQNNAGQAVARNNGLSIASGEYIGFVDSDDFVAHNMYEELMNLIVTYNVKIACCGFEKVFSTEQRLNTFINDLSVKLVEGKDIAREICKGVTLKTYVWDKLFHRSVFNEKRFPEGRYFEDTTLVCDLLCSVNAVVITGTKLYGYTIRNNSTMTLRSKKRYEDEITAYRDQLAVISKLDIAESQFVEVRLVEAIRYYLEICRKNEIDPELIKLMRKLYRKNISLLLSRKQVSLLTKMASLLCVLFPYLYIQLVKRIKNNG